MDTFCGLGLPEIIILVLISFVFIGPERSRELAITLGRWLRRVITSAWWREFNQLANSLRDLPNTLVRMSELEDSLRQMKTDLDQATQIDLDLTMPGMPQPPNTGTITDPYDSRNVTANTIKAPEEPVDASTPLEQQKARVDAVEPPEEPTTPPPAPPEAGETHDS